MKKILTIIIVIAAAICMTSCGTAKYAGTGIGYASSEQMSRDKGYVAAGIDASRKNNSTFSESIVVLKTDDNGVTSEKTEVTQTAETETTFYENSISYNVKRRGGDYKTTSKFSGTARKGKTNKD